LGDDLDFDFKLHFKRFYPTLLVSTLCTSSILDGLWLASAWRTNRHHV